MGTVWSDSTADTSQHCSKKSQHISKEKLTYLLKKLVTKTDDNVYKINIKDVLHIFCSYFCAQLQHCSESCEGLTQQTANCGLEVKFKREILTFTFA